jgi:hypothetical protein
VNYGATQYDWDAMLNTISTSAGEAITANALLQYHAGVSVNMMYAPDGSGAYSTDVPNALKTYFRYSSTVQYVARSGYTVTNWENMLKEQLDANKPIYYSGRNSDGGHAWVCDGYQKVGTTILFHFNFGWGGANNGYYTSASPGGFTTQHAIVRNIVPGTGYPYGCSAKTYEIPNGIIEDGSGPLALYNNDLACTWLIDPLDSVSSIKATFTRFDVSSSDTLYFYDGDNDGAPLLAAYSGNTVPASVSSTGDKLFIKFVTDGSVQDTGWLLEYSSVMPPLCGGTKNYTESTGAFTDGSGDYNYRNNSVCKFKIQPLYATDLTLTFDSFDLMPGDDISVFALSNNAQIATLTGNQIPDAITVPAGGLFLIFKTDQYYTGSGFSASYAVGNLSSKELSSISSLNISPNPASDFVMLRAYNSKYQSLTVSVSDMSGKTLYSETFTADKGSIEKPIDVSAIQPGMYFIKIRNQEGTVTEKLIVQ